MTFKRSLLVRGGPVAILIALLFANSTLAAGQSEWTVYSFLADRSQAVEPRGNLLADPAGNLYGASYLGGTFGWGTVYELVRPLPPKTAWTAITLHSFDQVIDGGSPTGGLVFDKAGNLYGTTYGEVFELTAPATAEEEWTLSVLDKFGQTGDGNQVNEGVVFDSTGNLYGTTHRGGVCCGTVFELTPPTTKGGEWTESVLYRFGSNFASTYPQSAPILDGKGNLYGTASAGGRHNGGVLWRLTRPATPGGAWHYKSLYVFGGGTKQYDPTDGYSPWASPTLHRGIFYGTTYTGGKFGLGTVFQVAPPNVAGGPWTENTLYSFSAGSQGDCPEKSLTFDHAGNIYGTTNVTRQGMCDGGKAVAEGAVYKLSPPATAGAGWTETTLHTFDSGNDGAEPSSGLVLGKNGVLFGGTIFGGAHNNGMVFGLVR